MSPRLLLLLIPTLVCAAPCTTATTNCTEWLTLGKSARSLIYRSHPLDQKNENIRRALIMVHGAGRDADNYFRTALAAAFLGGALDDTVVISPRFASNDGRSCKDTLASEEINWSCSGDSWRSGGVAISNGTLTSYDFTDELLRKLARKDSFPNLKMIVVAGHSAGGQYVTRYEMANQVHEKLGVAVLYVVSNPSSYAYLDSARPGAENASCASFDRWPYGMQNRTGYASKLSVEKLKDQLASRPVVYLLGELDTLPLAGFDSSCSAMAQGASRLARGQAFAAYVKEKYRAQHQVTTVPLCGHNARCIFTAEPALKVIFPTQ